MTKKLKTKPSTGDPFRQPGLRTTDLSLKERNSANTGTVLG